MKESELLDDFEIGDKKKKEPHFNGGTVARDIVGYFPIYYIPAFIIEACISFFQDEIVLYDDSKFYHFISVIFSVVLAFIVGWLSYYVFKVTFRVWNKHHHYDDYDLNVRACVVFLLGIGLLPLFLLITILILLGPPYIIWGEYEVRFSMILLVGVFVPVVMSFVYCRRLNTL